MTVNSSIPSGYASGLKPQSQSGASSVAPSGFGSMMQQVSDQLLSSLDTNSNGSIDKVEFSNAAQQLAQSATSSTDLDKIFSAIDKNSDGSIDSKELEQALLQSSAKNKAHGKHKHHNPLQDLTAPQAAQTTQSTSSQSASNDLQSILMKNILSAYNTSQSQKNGGTLSLSV